MAGIKIIKGKLDKIFSQYIRLRDRVSMTHCRCVDCGRLIDMKYECDAGHFVPRGRLSTRYHEQNVHAQAKKCNNKNWNQGEQYKHGKAIDRLYGEGTADRLMSMPKDGFKIDKSDYDEMIAFYTWAVEAMKQGEQIHKGE